MKRLVFLVLLGVAASSALGQYPFSTRSPRTKSLYGSGLYGYGVGGNRSGYGYPYVYPSLGAYGGRQRGSSLLLGAPHVERRWSDTFGGFGSRRTGGFGGSGYGGWWGGLNTGSDRGTLGGGYGSFGYRNPYPSTLGKRLLGTSSSLLAPPTSLLGSHRKRYGY